MNLDAGTRLGRYEIRAKVGKGGMGEVYLAEDTDLRRNVAVKILPGEVAANKDRMRRFEQEATAAAALNHPNIAHIYETGNHQDIRFIAMEFIDGQTLRQIIHEGDLPLEKLVRYLQQVAEGLAKAHASGIIHRDLKPDNIMVTGDGHAKILDFGLAKLVEQPNSGSMGSENATAIMPLQSEPGVLMGTVGYMSPEQAQGKSDRIDHRSDIFSFGCILYEAVTGSKAFAGNDAIDTLNKIIREQPPPVGDLRPDAPESLQRIVRRCLAKDPEDRYQSIKDIAIELRELKRDLAGNAERATSSSANPVSTRSGSLDAISFPASANAAYLSRGLKRHKIASSVAVLIIIALLTALGFYLHARNTETAIESIAVLPFEMRSSDSDADYLSDGLAESLIYRLSQLPNLKVSPTSSVLSYRTKTIDPVKAGQALGVSAVLSGRITQRGDNLTISAELVDVRYNKILWGEHYERKMSDLLSTQREIAREIVDKLKLRVSESEQGLAKHYTESNDAYQLYLKGRYYWNKRSEAGMQRALDFFQQAIDKDPNFALAYSGVADTYALLGAPDAGGSLSPNDAFPKARTAALKAIALDPTLAEPHVSLGHIKYYYERDSSGAEQEFKRAIELNPNYPQAHHWYALYLVWTGRNEEGLAEIRRARELDPLSLPINMSVGWLLCDAGRPDEGIVELRKTVDLDANFVAAHQRLALCYLRQNMFQEAISEAQKIGDLGSQVLSLSLLGQIYGQLDKKAEAREALAKLLEESKHRYISPAIIGLIYASLGEKDQAFAWLDKSVAEHDMLLVRLKTDNRSAPLRSDPRFEALVQRVAAP